MPVFRVIDLNASLVSKFLREIRTLEILQLRRMIRAVCPSLSNREVDGLCDLDMKKIMRTAWQQHR